MMPGSRRAHVISILLLPLLLLVVLIFHRYTAQAQTIPNPQTDGIDLILVPSRPTIQANELVDFDIWVYPNGHTVSAAELRINFDPNLFEPSSSQPFATHSAMPFILPNCYGHTTPPCPNLSSLENGHQAVIYLAVNCNETGCTLPNPDEKFLLATLSLKALASASGTTTIALNDPVSPTLTAAFTFDHDATRVKSNTSFTVAPCDLPYDFTPNGQIDVIDIIQAANRWNTSAGHLNYDGQFDVTRDGKINILDIQTVANTWNAGCNP